MKKNAKSKVKPPTLQETKELFVRQLSEGPLNASRRRNVEGAMEQVFVESLEDVSASELREWLTYAVVRQPKSYVAMDHDELFEGAKKLFCLDEEQDWADESIRIPFLEWLEDECRMPVEVA